MKTSILTTRLLFLWRKLTPWIKRGDAAALAEANKVMAKKQ